MGTAASAIQRGIRCGGSLLQPGAETGAATGFLDRHGLGKRASGPTAGNISSVCERLAEPRVSTVYCRTDEQRANGFTGIVSPHEWPVTLEQTGVVPNLTTASANAEQPDLLSLQVSYLLLNRSLGPFHII